MAETVVNRSLQVQQWDTKYLGDYIRDNLYFPYMSPWDRNGTAPIMAKEDLTTKAGQIINIPIIRNLYGNGVSGNQRLVGNEEALNQDSSPILVDWVRNGVVIKKPAEQLTEIDMRDAARQKLKLWSSTSLRDDITNALWAYDFASVVSGRTITVGAAAGNSPRQTPLQKYLSYSEATKDAYLAANSDRFLFGSAVSNNAGNDHSAALLNIDTTDDKMSAGIIRLAKTLIKETANKDNAIGPFRSDAAAGREWYVLFIGSRGFEQLSMDSFIALANREARPRDVESNPLFQGGDLIYNGVIIREIPEIPVVDGVGAAGSTVAPYFLVGAQAVGMAWAQRPVSRTKKETDYDFEYGVAIEEARGVAKLGFGGVQHGMVSGWYSAPAAV